MDFRSLDTFIKVSELHSFSKAARQLGYTQAAVSIQIARLEKEFGQIFFDRIGHNILLTEKGAQFLQYARQVTQLTEALADDFSGQDPVSGKLRIAMTDSLYSTRINDILIDFQKKHPLVSVTVRTGAIDDMLNWLNHNEVDFVYTLDNRIHKPELIMLEEKEIPVFFYARASHPLFARACVTLDDLTGYPIYLTEKGFSYRNNLEQFLSRQEKELLPAIETGNVHNICYLLRHSDGIAFLPSFVAEESAGEEALLPLPLSDLSVTIWSQLLYHRGKYVTRAMKEMLSLIYPCE